MTAHTTGLDFQDTKTAFASRSNSELWKMDLLFTIMNNPRLNKWATGMLLAAIRWGLPVKAVVKPTIFSHFCGGESWAECSKTMKKLARYGIGTILDYSVEGETSESAFDQVCKEILGTIGIAARSQHVPFAVFKTSGICAVSLLEKAQNGTSLTEDEQKTLAKARARFAQICKSAGESRVRLFVDAEESWIQDIIDQWTYEEMALYNREKAYIFNTFQLYRVDMLQNLKSAVAAAQQKGYIIGAKLVRGAYMEKEAAWAASHKKPNPIQPDKASSDRDFNLALDFCLDQLNHIHFCAGSHNEESNARLASAMLHKNLQPNDERIWFAQLFGMSDNISYALAKGGFNVAKYVPYGPVLAVMPYLVRRAAENTSVAGQTSRELMLIQKERNRRRQSA